jgi:hypothetical protein
MAIVLGTLSILTFVLVFVRDLAKADRKDRRSWRATIWVGLALTVVNGTGEVARRWSEATKEVAARERETKAETSRALLREELRALGVEAAAANREIERLVREVPAETAARLAAEALGLQRRVATLAGGPVNDTDTSGLLQREVETLRRSVQQLRTAVEEEHAAAARAAVAKTQETRLSAPHETVVVERPVSQPAPVRTPEPTAVAPISNRSERSNVPPPVVVFVPPAPTATSDEVRSQELSCRLGSSSQFGSGWCDLEAPTTFAAGTCLKLQVGGSARQVVVRLLARGQDPNEAVGVVGGAQSVPATRLLVLKLPRTFPNTIQLSVHGNSSAWQFSLGTQNGPADLLGVERVACPIF